MSAMGERIDEVDLRLGGGDLVNLAPVKPLKTLARPPGRLESGDEGASPGEGDMCSSDWSDSLGMFLEDRQTCYRLSWEGLENPIHGGEASCRPDSPEVGVGVGEQLVGRSGRGAARTPSNKAPGSTGTTTSVRPGGD